MEKWKSGQEQPVKMYMPDPMRRWDAILLSANLTYTSRPRFWLLNKILVAPGYDSHTVPVVYRTQLNDF